MTRAHQIGNRRGIFLEKREEDLGLIAHLVAAIANEGQEIELVAVFVLAVLSKIRKRFCSSSHRDRSLSPAPLLPRNQRYKISELERHL